MVIDPSMAPLHLQYYECYQLCVGGDIPSKNDERHTVSDASFITQQWLLRQRREREPMQLLWLWVFNSPVLEVAYCFSRSYASVASKLTVHWLMPHRWHCLDRREVRSKNTPAITPYRHRCHQREQNVNLWHCHFKLAVHIYFYTKH